MLGLATNLAKGGASLLTYVKDNLKLYLDFKSTKSDTLKFPCEGSTSFDGSNDGIDTGNIFSGGETQATFSAWIYADESGGSTDKLVGQTDESNNAADPFIIFWVHSSNAIQFWFSDGGGTNYRYIASSAVTANTWHHLACTADLSTGVLKMYLDGVDLGLTVVNNASPPSSVTANTTTNYIGQGRSTGGDMWKGKIANMAIWTRVLSIEEINSVMRKNYSQLKSVEKTSLVSWWALDTETLSDNLATGWTSSDAETLTTSGANITSLVNSNGHANVHIQPQMVVRYRVYKVSYDYTLVSGDHPYFFTATNGSQDSNISTISTMAGMGSSWYFTAGTATGLSFWRDANFSITVDNFSIKAVTSADSHGSNTGYYSGATASNTSSHNSATTTTSVYGGNAPVLPRAVDVAREGEAEAIGDGSASFDGTDDYIEIANSSAINIEGDMTITAWVNPSGTTSFRVFVFKRDGGGTNYQFYMDSSATPKLRFWDGSGADSPDASLVKDEWQHVAISIDSGTTDGSIFYHNGVPDSNTATFTISANDAPLLFGKHSVNATFADMKMSQVGIWRGVLTQAQIQSVMESTSYDKIPVDVKNKYGDELIVNGTMEADSNWSNYNTPDVNERSSEQAHSGTYSRKVDTNANYEGISSDGYTTVTGNTYTVSFWVYPTNVDSIRVRIQEGDGSGDVATSSGTNPTFSSLNLNAWNEVTFTYVESSGGSSGKLIIESGANTGANNSVYYIDDASVKEIKNEIAGYWALDDDNSSKLPDFNSSDNYVNLGRINLYQGAFSCSYWVYHDTNNGTKGHFILPYDGSSWTSPYVRWIIRTINPGGILNYTGSWGTGGQVNSSMPTGEWIHIVYTHDGTTSSGSNIWINGVKELTYSSSQATLTDEGTNLYMGTSYGIYSSGSEMFDGFIHNVAFMTSAVISDANIASIYALGRDGDFRTVLTPNHYYNHHISAWASGSGAIPDIVGDKNGTLSGTAQILTAYKVNDLTDNNNDGELK